MPYMKVVVRKWFHRHLHDKTGLKHLLLVNSHGICHVLEDTVPTSLAKLLIFSCASLTRLFLVTWFITGKRNKIIIGNFDLPLSLSLYHGTRDRLIACPYVRTQPRTVFRINSSMFYPLAFPSNFAFFSLSPTSLFLIFFLFFTLSRFYENSHDRTHRVFRSNE